MSGNQPLLAPGSPLDLTNCDLEPIHIPSLIQPHGMLLAARSHAEHGEDGQILYTSGNSQTILGIAPADIFERTLHELLGADAVAAIEAALGDQQEACVNVLISRFPISGDRRFDVSAHRANGLLYVELEPATEERRWGLVSSVLERAMRTLRAPVALSSLCAAIPPLIRELTGYDRVMVYQFDSDGHGEVVAEAKDDQMEPFLGLHYPATDIPAQARKLYLLQRLRMLVDINYEPVPVLCRPSLVGSAPLDMTYCGLRSISPIHVEYLQNMGVGASLALSLVHRGKFWGMIVCHHRTTRKIAPESRTVCDLLGQHISLLIGMALQSDEDTERAEKSALLASLAARLAAPGSSIEAAFASQDLLTVLNADGALIRIGEQAQLIGATPPLAEAEALLFSIKTGRAGGTFFTDHLGAVVPDFASLFATASGVYLVQLVEPTEGILWFRGEVARTVNWAGKPDASKQYFEGSYRLSPRKSFALWKEIQAGRSLPWRASETEAALNLQRILSKALLERKEREILRLRSRDQLTGLPNRVALVEHLGRWQSSGNQAPASLLFLDLDKMHTINERYGYAAGDELLKQVGARLSSLDDGRCFVARHSGDEFVLFCENTGLAAAELLADTILHTLPGLPRVDGQPISTTTSIGIAPVSQATATDILDPLRAADSAMYVAKHKGGNQVSIVESRQQAAALRTEMEEVVKLRQQEAVELAITYRQLKSVMDSTSDGVLEVNYNWIILYGNLRAIHALPDFEVGASFWDCFPALLSTPVETNLRLVMEKRREMHFEHFYEPYQAWHRISAFPVDGGISIFFREVTTEKALESQLNLEQLLREKRIEALSHMAGGLAHEISNPLAIIHGLASDLQMLASLAAPGSPLAAAEVEKTCDDIVRTSDRAMRILRGLRGFAREGRQDPMALASIAEILDECMHLQEARFNRHKIDIQIAIQPDCPPLLCREVQIGQILTNLLNNAFDAIVQSNAAERWVSIAIAWHDDEMIIDVADSGPGVEDHFKAHLMEPFFTTKELGLGMGVGLSLSRAITQDHGGTLTLRSDTEHTCFRLTLPAPAGATLLAAAEAANTASVTMEEAL